MGVNYLKKKGCESKGHQQIKKRDESLTYLTFDQILQILEAVKLANKKTMKRDHALIYLSYMLGLRVAEAVRLTREHFVDIERGRVWIPTLKNAPRLRVQCECGRKFGVSSRRIGEDYPCPRCGKPVHCKKPKRDLGPDIPLIAVDMIEPSTISYIKRYLDSLPEEQDCLFERKGARTPPRRKSNQWSARFDHCHIGVRHAQTIFATYCDLAGLEKEYSSHGMRHGRALNMWEGTADLKSVQSALRHKSMAVSEHYTHLSPKKRDEHIKRLEASNPLKDLDLP